MNKELLEHWDGLRLLFQGGKLWNSRSEGWRGERLKGKNRWRNCVEHQVTQLRAARAFQELLGLSPSDGDKLATVALVHDWKKRMEKGRGDFSAIEKRRAEVLLKRVNPDPDLMVATKPEFLEKVLAGKPSFLEFLQFYLDTMTMGSEIVPIKKRINEAIIRNKKLGVDKELERKLGGRKYWDVEIETDHMVEEMIYNKLINRGVNITSSEEIPNLIRRKIEEQIGG